MQKAYWLVVGTLATILLGACAATDPALESPEPELEVTSAVEAPALRFRQACGSSEYTRLRVRDRVVVSDEAPISIQLRSGPGLAGSVIGTLERGDEAEIVGGPNCSDGSVWWELQSLVTDMSGWAAQGDADGALLLPTGS